MAVYRFYQECEVCQTVTLIRVQAGHLPRHPVRVYCGNCEILFSGEVLFNEDIPNVQLRLNNSIPLINNEGDDYKFAIEVSGELPTMKLYTGYHEIDSEYIKTPFIRLMGLIGHEKYDDFGAHIRFMRTIPDSWPRVRRISELFYNKKWELLNRELRKSVRNKNLDLLSEIDYLMAVHQYTIQFLSTSLKPTEFFADAQHVSKEVFSYFGKNINKEMNNEFQELIAYIDKKGLQRLQEKTFKCIETFIEKFQYMLPGFALFYISSMPDHSRLGVTTASFEDLKAFYVDSYETMMDHIDILIGLNNLKHRGSFRKMRTMGKKVTDIEHFEKLSNGKKIVFISGDETFDQLLVSKFNHQLRNAIGHASTHIDGIDQVITYYPKPNELKDSAETIYLIDFIKKCVDQFSALMSVGELLYSIRKIKCLQNGQVPTGVNVVDDDIDLTPSCSVNLDKGSYKRAKKNIAKKKTQKKARRKNRG